MRNLNPKLYNAFSRASNPLIDEAIMYRIIKHKNNDDQVIGIDLELKELAATKLGGLVGIQLTPANTISITNFIYIIIGKRKVLIYKDEWIQNKSKHTIEDFMSLFVRNIKYMNSQLPIIEGHMSRISDLCMECGIYPDDVLVLS